MLGSSEKDVNMTTETEQRAMDGSPAVVELFNRKNLPGDDFPAIGGPFGEIHFQFGPIDEVGINGTTIEDVAEVLIDRLRGFQTNKDFACRENALAITAFEEGVNWLLQRTRKRQAQGVEGRNEPHTE